MKDVIITGATGMIGSAVTKIMLEKGINVTAIVRPMSENLEYLEELEAGGDFSAPVEYDAETDYTDTDVGGMNIGRNLIFVTEEGKAKRVNAALFDTARKTAAAIKSKPVFVGFEDDYVVAETADGYSIKVKSSELPVQGKGAGGVTLISLRKGDKVVSAMSGSNSDSFKDISLSDMKAVKRGGKGNKKGK